MSPERQDPSARAADIAEQQLQDCSRANDLCALRVLRPPYRVTNSSCFFRAGSGSKNISDLQELLFGNAASALDQFRRIAREVLLQDLKPATGMREGGIIFMFTDLAGFATAIFPMSATHSRVS